MSIDLWDLWKDVSSFDPELPTGLSHILGHLGPELSLVQSPNAPRTAWTRNQKVSGKLGLIAPLLDSLISLLPYKPQAQFAGTLALSKKSARLCVSADDDSQLDLALQNTTAIEKCWTLVQDSINDVDSGVPSSIELICKCTLVRSFITHHLGSGRQYSRFQKRSRECAACFAYLRTCNLPCVSGAIERSYLDISEKVFHLYEQAFASDVWTDQDLVQLCEYANAIKCLEEQNPTRNTRAFVSSASRWFQHGSILESVLPLPLNALPRRWDFDAVRYIDKLIRPALQAIELYRLSKRSTFRKMFKGRSLHIVGVRATDYGTRHPPSIGIDAIHRLVHEIPGHPKDQETLIGQINSAFPDTYPDANIAFKSHPECQLVRYHDEHPPYSERPFPYIATYKLSCFSCWDFVSNHRHLAKVHTHCTEWVRFVLRGWKGRIESNWCFPVTCPDHKYSRLIGVRMQYRIVNFLRLRMVMLAKSRARQDRLASSRA